MARSKNFTTNAAASLAGNERLLAMKRFGGSGQIPVEEWPSILARYQSGETITQLAVSYECSPPAITYVISRGRTQIMMSEDAIPLSSRQRRPPRANSRAIVC